MERRRRAGHYRICATRQSRSPASWVTQFEYRSSVVEFNDSRLTRRLIDRVQGSSSRGVEWRRIGLVEDRLPADWRGAILHEQLVERLERERRGIKPFIPRSPRLLKPVMDDLFIEEHTRPHRFASASLQITEITPRRKMLQPV